MTFKLSPIPLLNTNQLSIEEKRKEIKDYLKDTFELEDSLFSLLNNDNAFHNRPDPLRHPLIFYYGHTPTFYINKLILSKQLLKRVNESYESLFAIGIDEMYWDQTAETSTQWPNIIELKAYREKVKKVVLNLIDHIPLEASITTESPIWPIMMGIEHQKIHIETSSVLIRQLPLSFLTKSPLWQACKMQGEAPENSLIEVPNGTIERNKEDGDDLYGWDNEYGSRTGQVSSFRAAKYLTSNDEFAQFIDQEQYSNDEWWSHEGLTWREFNKKSMPSFWIKRDEQYFLRTLQEEIPMPWDWPVEVNFHEAKAFCNWKSFLNEAIIRLPSEDEYQLLHNHCKISNVHQWKNAPGNINLEHFASSCPINLHKTGEFFDVIGNVWQWTETPIYPLQGFRPHSLYDDFSIPTFDDKHNLIKGGSWISTGNLANKDSRYAFRRHFQQHAGFRYIESKEHIHTESKQYNTDKILSEYCNMHYGASYFGVPNFPKSCVDTIKDFIEKQGHNTLNALDLGCAVGRSTFELAKYFDNVTGLDFSARFISKATSIKQSGKIKYELMIEGDLFARREQSLEKLDLNRPKGKVEFFQADACNLSKKWLGYDLIFAANLIDRLYSPKDFLTTIQDHMNINGLLVLVSPYTWLEEHTSKEEWIGGKKVEGKDLTTLEGLKAILAPHFVLAAEPIDIPFIIRETRRKYQHTVSEMTIWKCIKN